MKMRFVVYLSFDFKGRRTMTSFPFFFFFSFFFFSDFSYFNYELKKKTHTHTHKQNDVVGCFLAPGQRTWSFVAFVALVLFSGFDGSSN